MYITYIAFASCGDVHIRAPFYLPGHTYYFGDPVVKLVKLEMVAASRVRGVQKGGTATSRGCLKGKPTGAHLSFGSLQQ